ncbi:hypothetical protein Ahy_B04g073397 isoform D [Arachis hypogaea]|uniref:Palmitoyl-protein thioesterase 1 n=1 Tax=Arachis hypogaea TaxID=3818 RepID=A0A444ZQF7_ARAHY|nr:hypothetical protein Ahy_B04g073397 isoform D [Arachis hypogaea]
MKTLILSLYALLWIVSSNLRSTANLCSLLLLFVYLMSRCSNILLQVAMLKYQQMIENIFCSCFFYQDISDYIEGCNFLPKLNNEISTERNSTYKQRFASLQNLVLIMFEQDTILIPKETAWFGYYPDGAFHPVLAPQQTKLYIEDWIGLRTLDEAGKVKFISVSGDHLGISSNDMKTYIVPYLEDHKSTVSRPKIEESLFHVWISSIRISLLKMVGLNQDLKLFLN